MNKILQRAIVDLTPPVLLRTAKKIMRGKYVAKDGLDKKMEKYLNYSNGFYVELGANNGIKESNTYYFERYKNWRGVLIEPSPNKFIECRQNRSEANAFFCNACVSFAYQEEFVKIVYSNLMSAPANLESDIADPLEHARKGQAYLPDNEMIFEFGAKAKPLGTILNEANAPSVIDFLSLDVEGAELEVLKGVNHAVYQFKFMLVECRDFKRLENYLVPLGYSLIEQLSHHDYLFSYNEIK